MKSHSTALPSGVTRHRQDTTVQDIFAFIEQQKQEFAQLPFFQVFLDSTIEPVQRLSFMPYAAPLVMGFAELNRAILRDESSYDPIQLLINQHTYEDDYHWEWFLSDLQTFGVDPYLKLTDTLKFLWGDKNQAARRVIYELHHHTYQTTLIQKLIMIQAMEATSNVFFAAAAQVGEELQVITRETYQYFSKRHFVADAEHTLHSTELWSVIRTMPLTKIELEKACYRIEKTFEAFTVLMDVFLTCIQRSHKPSGGNKSYFLH